MFDMLDRIMRCRIICKESSHWGYDDDFFFIDYFNINSLWWISEEVMLDIIHWTWRKESKARLLWRMLKRWKQETMP